MSNLKSKPYWDYWLEAVRIAHFCPGLGDPWQLSLAQWNTVLSRLEDLKEEIIPTSDDEHMTGTTLRLAAQMQRQELREKAYYGG